MLNHNAITFNHLEFRIVYKLAARLEGESACHTRRKKGFQQSRKGLSATCTTDPNQHILWQTRKWSKTNDKKGRVLS